MNINALYRAIYMFKEARATKVTVSKDDKSWTFPSMEAASRYFGFISSLSSHRVMKMLEGREKYICGFYITYED